MTDFTQILAQMNQGNQSLQGQLSGYQNPTTPQPTAAPGFNGITSNTSAPQQGGGLLGNVALAAGGLYAAKKFGPSIASRFGGIQGTGMVARAVHPFYAPAMEAASGAHWAAGAGAATEGGLTTLGTIAAPIAGLAGGALAYKGINSLDVGGEGSTADRGLSGAGGGALAGAGIGTAIAPGIGTVIGAGVGALAGGIASIAWGDDEKDLAAKLDKKSSKLDKRFDRIIATNDIAPEIALQAKDALLESLRDIRAMDIGTDEKIELFGQLGDATEEALREYKGSRQQLSNARATEAQAIKDQEAYTKAQVEAEQARAIQMQQMIGDYMKPYADAAGGQMGAAIMAQAQATPAILAMDRQATLLKNLQDAQSNQYLGMNAQANMLNAQANMMRAQNPSIGSGGGVGTIDALTGS